ncbi:hypothetical protein MLD38_036333 [Melastoma candidum]|uniref:Uncharacterized protein n=1 Tax=Melastoma candidum TaxID=119954 RepID=A0ACB9LL84_9MYRT|nr:hypothetical protein MLD38_036333 [Melastoma candidum]
MAVVTLSCIRRGGGRLCFFAALLLLLPTSLSASDSPTHQILPLLPLPLPLTTSSQLPITAHDDASSSSSSLPSLSVQLHHVGSFLNVTPRALLELRLRQDAIRVKALSALASRNGSSSSSSSTVSGFSSSVTSGLSLGSGEYFARFGVGTPPRYLFMVLDTGSDVVWLQCAPCRKCYSQTDRLFYPSKSKSYSGIPCRSPTCQHLDSHVCDPHQRCLYRVNYGDGSSTSGEFATETLTFHGTSIPRVALGCGHDNQGLFVGAAGLLGLGRGKLSFPEQAGHQFGGKFSYCLVDRSASSKPSFLIFGDKAVSRTAQFTPMIRNPKLDTFYYVELVGISVGGTRVAGIKPSMFRLSPTGDGGVIVDSGTSVTRLARPAYTFLRQAFRAGASDLTPAGEFSLFDTCYDLSGKTEVTVPTVVMHFKGADVLLPASNYLIPVDENGKFCFAFAGTSSGLSIIGNIQQQGFRVVFDLGGSRVGFAPKSC